MPETQKRLIETLVSGGIIGTAGGLITMLMSKVPMKEKFRNLVAGILASLLASYILRNSVWAETFKECFIGSCAAFIAVYYPLLESIVRWIIKKYIQKKIGVDIFNDKIEKDVDNTDIH